MKLIKIFIKKEFYSVYLLFEKESKTCFIGYCKSTNLMGNYRSHYCEDNPKTADWIHNMKKNNTRPCVLVLNHLHATKPVVYKYVVAWTALVQEQGYTTINQGLTNEYAADMVESTYEIYEKIKSNQLEDMTQCSNCILPKYKNVFCSNYKANGDETNHDE